MIPTEQIRPEDALILSCVRKCSNSERTDRMKDLIKKGIDWSYLIQASIRHGLLPIVYKALEAACPKEIPSDILGQLRQYFRANTLRNLALTAELINLLRLLKTHGISAIPYKGPALAVLAYGDVSYRQFADLDIVVHKQDVLKIKEILIPRGYKPEYELIGMKEFAYLKSNCMYNFWSESNGVLLEVHWDLLPNFFAFPFDLKGSWDHLKVLSISGSEVSTFSPEDLLLILCAQYGCKHCWERLGWICDVARLIETSNGLVSERVLKQAREMGMERTVLLGFFLANNLTGTDLPENVWKEIDNQPVVRKLAESVHQRLFDDADNPTGIFKDQLLYLKMRERFLDKARYVFYLTFTPNVRDWEFLSLPNFLFFLYYILRPFRLVLRYGARLSRVVFK